MGKSGSRELVCWESGHGILEVKKCWLWGHTPLISAPRKQRHTEHWESEASLLYTVGCRPVRGTYYPQTKPKTQQQKLVETLKKS